MTLPAIHTLKFPEEYGAAIAVNDILPQEEAAEILADAQNLAGQVLYFRANITQPAEIQRLFDSVAASLKLPDIVCCHAGMAEAFPVEEYPLQNFETLLDLNLHAPFKVAQVAARRWIEHGLPGHLIFTSSWVQDVPWPEITPYNVSKAGLKALMRGFARELAPQGIRSNAIAPGIVAVGMAKRQWDHEPQYRARAEKAIPLGYLQPAESVAQAFLFLCSTMADYMTGAVLLVDGGCSLYPMD
ncbi:MAG: SDR family oxidoreductase [Chloroflexi bacterium]|nr:SDR family oxidoreductase [Chloroflexota bacterium]